MGRGRHLPWHLRRDPQRQEQVHLQIHQEMIKGTETRRDGTVEFPAHVLFKVELTELQNCTSAYVLLQQVTVHFPQ